MKTIIICQSIHHGNTKKIAQVFAEILNSDIISPADVTNFNIDEYDLIGFGSGIYAGKHHSSLFKFIKELKTCNKTAFIFSTRAIHPLTFYHKILRNRLADKGFTILDEFSCQGFSTYGPLKLIGGINKGKPNQDDLSNAKIFAQNLKQKFLSLNI